MNTAVASPTQEAAAIGLRGTKTLVYGPIGTGKTHSLRTAVQAGLELFVEFTEPGMDILSDTDPDKVHWHYCQPGVAKISTMISTAKLIQQFDNGALQKMAGIEKNAYGQYISLLQSIQNFKCDRCGKEFGDVTEWGQERMFALDGASGLNIMALNLAVGSKPVRTQPDWGVAMEQEEALLNLLTLGTKCHVAVLAHADRETDLVSGGIKVYPALLGRKLAPVIGRFFTDVVYAERAGTTFTWSTTKIETDAKARNLDWKNDLQPSFVPLIQRWKSRQFKG